MFREKEAEIHELKAQRNSSSQRLTTRQKSMNEFFEPKYKGNGSNLTLKPKMLSWLIWVNDPSPF